VNDEGSPLYPLYKIVIWGIGGGKTGRARISSSSDQRVTSGPVRN